MLQVSHVIAISDPEVIVGIGGLINTVSRGGSADGHDGGGAFSPLLLTDVIHLHHVGA